MARQKSWIETMKDMEAKEIKQQRGLMEGLMGGKRIKPIGIGQGYYEDKSGKKRKLTDADKKRIASKQKWKCNKCEKLLPTRYHIDHKKRFSGGGSDKESNLQALCGTCHDIKTEEERNIIRQDKIKQKEKEEKKQHKAQPPQFGFGIPPQRKSGQRKIPSMWDY